MYYVCNGNVLDDLYAAMMLICVVSFLSESRHHKLGGDALPRDAINRERAVI